MLPCASSVLQLGRVSFQNQPELLERTQLLGHQNYGKMEREMKDSRSRKGWELLKGYPPLLGRNMNRYDMIYHDMTRVIWVTRNG